MSGADEMIDALYRLDTDAYADRAATMLQREIERFGERLSRACGRWAENVIARIPEDDRVRLTLLVQPGRPYWRGISLDERTISTFDVRQDGLRFEIVVTGMV